MFNKKCSSARAPSASANSTRSVLDSTNPASPMYTLDYVVPVHSFADSVAILRRAQGARTGPTHLPSAQAAPNRAALLKQLNQQSFSVHEPSLNSDLRHLVDPQDARARVASPAGYDIPVHNLSDSIKILRNFGRKNRSSQ